MTSLMAEPAFQVPYSQTPPIQQTSLAINDLIKAIVDPSEFMKRLRKALMGNCEWYWDQATNDNILGEWVYCGTVKPAEGRMIREIIAQDGLRVLGYELFIVPPKNPPLVRNSKLLYAVESYFYGLINGPIFMSRPEVPNVMANMGQWTFIKYLVRNWEEFQLDTGTADTLAYLYGQTAFAMYNGAQKGDNKRFMSSLMTITENRQVITEVPKENKGILGAFRQ